MSAVQRLIRGVALASTCSTVLSPWISLSAAALESAFSARNNFARDMQESCHTPALVLSEVGRRLSVENDPEGKMSSLVLVRLAKMMISQSNEILYGNERNAERPDISIARDALLEVDDTKGARNALRTLQHVSDTLAEAVATSAKGSGAAQHDTHVEGIKAAGVLSRLLFSTRAEGDPVPKEDVFSSLGKSFRDVSAESMGEHHLSGLKWAYDSLALRGDREPEGGGDDGLFEVPERIASAHRRSNLPFRVRPGFLSDKDRFDVTVSSVRSQVDFRTEEIRTAATKKVVRERRQTAWEGEGYVPGFEYSGKVMETRAFSPVVKCVRDELKGRTGTFYDCCLLNLYPDGDSGMRYHIDPEQGEKWGYETAVVSVGAARRFAFREIGPDSKKPHNFVLMDGDVVEMFEDCQFRFQHTVKTAEGRHETAPRCSMVFKQYLR